MYGYLSTCSNKEINTLLKREAVYLNMRFAVRIALIYMLCSAQRCTPSVGVIKIDPDTVTVTIKVTTTTPYCGGARPSDEILFDSRKPKPLKGQLFHLKEGTTNSLKTKELAQQVTDTAGTLVFKLIPGKYMLLLPEQMVAMDTTAFKDNRYYKFDRKCLHDWWKKPVLLLEVTRGEGNLFTLHFDRKCFVSGWSPCESYVGPPPPAQKN